MPTARPNFQPASRDEERDPHGELDRAARQACDDACTEPSAHGGARNRGHQQRGIHDDGRDENQRFGHDGRSVADIERARYLFIGDHAPQFVDRRGRRERTNAQRVEESGNESDGKFQGRGPAPVRAAPAGADCADDEGNPGERKGDIQSDLCAIHLANIPVDEPEYSGSSG
jgi:hypothetical protein